MAFINVNKHLYHISVSKGLKTTSFDLCFIVFLSCVIILSQMFLNSPFYLVTWPKKETKIFL